MRREWPLTWYRLLEMLTARGYVMPYSFCVLLRLRREPNAHSMGGKRPGTVTEWYGSSSFSAEESRPRPLVTGERCFDHYAVRACIVGRRPRSCAVKRPAALGQDRADGGLQITAASTLSFDHQY